MARKTSRRDFLQAGSGAKAMGKPAEDADSTGGDSASRPDPTAESYLIRISREAMACRFEVVLNAGQYPEGTEAALEALDLVQALEDQMSVFRPASEISCINRSAADEPVEVEPRLFELLQLALRLHTETDGAFDVTSGPLWKAWGFARRAGKVPDPGELAEARSRVGSHLLELDPDARTVRFRKPGVEINLGSIGKGYALDRASHVLRNAGIDDFLFHGGMSSVTAQGTRTPSAPSEDPIEDLGWTVGLSHPLRRGKRLAEIRLKDQSLGTSGSGTQFFRHQGRRYGHILDPRTGHPAEGALSVTVVAPEAALADALATAFYVMGPDRSSEFCRDRPDVAAVVCPPARGARVDLHTVGLKDDQLVRLSP